MLWGDQIIFRTCSLENKWTHSLTFFGYDSTVTTNTQAHISDPFHSTLQSSPGTHSLDAAGRHPQAHKAAH